jgi:dolichol-phosphate mannosyltransferase
MADKCDTEFIFSDNHSDDSTWEKLCELAQKDTRVRAIRFSKNIGFQRSILANYMHARGDAVMQIDADLQDPPEMLLDFYSSWKEGADVVYGIRKRRQEGVFPQLLRRFGYWVIDKISEHPIPLDAGDFRLLDRKVVNAILKIKTAKPYLRGMIAGIGFKQIGIPYDRNARTVGKSKFNVNQVLKLGLAAVFNHSTVPLRAASFLGANMLAISIVGTFYYVALKFIHPETPQGLASIHILVLFGIGLNSFLFGIIGEYLLRIYLVLRAEPVATIDKSINFDSSELKL